MKKIMIVGGGLNQMILIKTAKKENYTVVLCDKAVDCPGRNLADIFYEVDILDVKALIDVAKREKIDGVISNSELAMQNIAEISQAVGVNGNKKESIDAVMSKAKFRNLQKESKVFAPKHLSASTFEEIERDIHELNFSVIVKPAESSGTRGTTVVDSISKIDMIKDAFDKCSDYSRDKKVTVEEYVPMPSLDMIESDIFVYKNEILWDGIFTTRRSKDYPMLPMTYSMPCDLNENELKRFKEDVSSVIKTSGIQHGEYNIEAYFTENKELFIIEINARQGGNQIPELIKQHSGVDMDKLLVTTAVGDDYYFEHLKNMERENNLILKHAIFGRKSGKLKDIYIDELVRDNVKNITYLVKIGECIELQGNANDEVAVISLQFDNRDVQKKIAENIETYIYAVIE